MNDKERTIEAESYHIILAIRRKKDNPELKELVFRQIVRDEEVDINILKARVSMHKGLWRIYHTINKRLHEPAMKGLMKRLIDHPEDSYRIDTLFKTYLLKPECKATRNFLIDIDTLDEKIINKVHKILIDAGVEASYTTYTPNGYHIVTKGKFDTRLLDNIDDVTFQRDGYYLYAIINNKEDKDGEQNTIHNK